jgi:hypothetical protein
MGIIKKTTTDAGEDAGVMEPLYIHCWWKCSLVQPLQTGTDVSQESKNGTTRWSS